MKSLAAVAITLFLTIGVSAENPETSPAAVGEAPNTAAMAESDSPAAMVADFPTVARKQTRPTKIQGNPEDFNCDVPPCEGGEYTIGSCNCNRICGTSCRLGNGNSCRQQTGQPCEACVNTDCP